MTNIITIAAPAKTNATVKVELIETVSGQWKVRDEADTKGGIFHNVKAASRFIRDEFGDDAEITTFPFSYMAA